MVPALFVTLDVLPLTSNGKVDRNALPEPPSETFTDPGLTPPRGPLEEAVAAIWTELLGLERVARIATSSVWAVDSLMAAKVTNRVERIFDVRFPSEFHRSAHDLPRRPQLLESAMDGGTAVRVPPVRHVDRNNWIPVSFAQHRLWFLDELDTNQTSYNVPVVLRLAGKLDISRAPTLLERS